MAGGLQAVGGVISGSTPRSVTPRGDTWRGSTTWTRGVSHGLVGSRPLAASFNATARSSATSKLGASQRLKVTWRSSLTSPRSWEADAPASQVLGLDDDESEGGASKSTRGFSKMIVVGGQREPQRAHWTIRDLQVDKKLQQVRYRGLVVVPGRYITSPSFVIAGQETFLRFWPNGYFNGVQRRERREHDLGGWNADSWCAVGLVMPAGIQLRLRFHVGDQRSDVRDCYFDNTGSVVKQVWMPDAKEAPELADLTIGVEVLRDLRDQAGSQPQQHTPGSTPRGATPRGPAQRRREMVERAEAEAPDAIGTLCLAREAAGLPLPSPRLVMVSDWRS